MSAGWEPIADAWLAHVRFLTDGLEIESWHRPLVAYARALEAAGLLIEALRELPGVNRRHLPISLHLQALEP